MVDGRERACLKVHQPARQRFLIYPRLYNKTPRRCRVIGVRAIVTLGARPHECNDGREDNIPG